MSRAMHGSNMLAIVAFAVQAAAGAVAAPAHAQGPNLRPATPHSVTISAARHHTPVDIVSVGGESVVDGDRLAAALGGTLKRTTAGRVVLSVGESTVQLADGLPFATIDDSTVIPLASAPHFSGRTVYVPFQFVSEVVPRFLSGFFYDAAAAEVRVFDPTARRVVAPDPTLPDVTTPDDAADAAPDSESSANSALPPSAELETPSKPRRGIKHLVVVDAGHGGVDNGMTGPIGDGPRVVEKNITLSVAKLVAAELRSQGVSALMTRTTDTLIGLYDRGPIANRNHADLFVSIHVNATGSRGPSAARERGFETYFLAEAKTEDARRVEQMENSAVKFETGVNAPKGDPLGFILNDMAQNEHLRESSELATIIQHGLSMFHPGPNRGVQQANFAVLRGSFMPAVLVEIGFGTNPQEAAYITDPDNQRTIARSIVKSIISYLDRYDARVRNGR